MESKEEGQDSAVVWTATAASPSTASSSGEPAATPAPAAPVATAAEVEAEALLCDDEKEALSLAALSAAAAARKMAAARNAAAAQAARAQPKAFFSTGSLGVAESKPGKSQPAVEASPPESTTAAMRSTTPTPTFTSFAAFSPPASASRSQSPQYQWGPSFGIASKPTGTDQRVSSFSPPATISPSAAAAASPLDPVAAALTAAGVTKRKLQDKEEEEEEEEGEEDRTSSSPWLLLEGSPTFGAKDRPQMPEVTQEELREGAAALMKRLRTEASRTDEAHVEIRLLLNPPAATSS